MIALGRIDDLKRLLAMRWARLLAWREGNSHLRDGTCVGVSRVKGFEVPWHHAEHRPRDPHDVYLRDEDADLIVMAITLLPELLEERGQLRDSLKEMVHFARLQGCNRTKDGPCACCDAIKRAAVVLGEAAEEYVDGRCVRCGGLGPGHTCAATRAV